MRFLVPNDVALQRIDAAGHPFGAFLGSPRTGLFHGVNVRPKQPSGARGSSCADHPAEWGNPEVTLCDRNLSPLHRNAGATLRFSARSIEGRSTPGQAATEQPVRNGIPVTSGDRPELRKGWSWGWRCFLTRKSQRFRSSSAYDESRSSDARSLHARTATSPH